MFAAQNAVFKELLREQRKCYDGALSAVMNEILIALGESEVGAAGIRLDSLESRMDVLEATAVEQSNQPPAPGPAPEEAESAKLPEVKMPSWKNPFGKKEEEEEKEEEPVEEKKSGLFGGGLFGSKDNEEEPEEKRGGFFGGLGKSRTPSPAVAASVTFSKYKRDKDRRRQEREQRYQEDYYFYRKQREQEKGHHRGHAEHEHGHAEHGQRGSSKSSRRRKTSDREKAPPDRKSSPQRSGKYEVRNLDAMRQSSREKM